MNGSTNFSISIQWNFILSDKISYLIRQMVGWHLWLYGHEFEQALGVGDGQGSLAYCSLWGCKESDRLSNWTELNRCCAPIEYTLIKWTDQSTEGTTVITTGLFVCFNIPDLLLKKEMSSNSSKIIFFSAEKCRQEDRMVRLSFLTLPSAWDGPPSFWPTIQIYWIFLYYFYHLHSAFTSTLMICNHRANDLC